MIFQRYLNGPRCITRSNLARSSVPFSLVEIDREVQVNTVTMRTSGKLLDSLIDITCSLALLIVLAYTIYRRAMTHPFLGLLEFTKDEMNYFGY
jgi:hypothetical protein